MKTAALLLVLISPCRPRIQWASDLTLLNFGCKHWNVHARGGSIKNTDAVLRIIDQLFSPGPIMSIADHGDSHNPSRKRRTKKASGLAFANFINGFAGNNKNLPLIHTTQTKLFRDIINSRRISRKECETFHNEQVAYMFYGRPAYRLADVGDKPSRLYATYPAAIIFSPDIIAQADRIYPFDTGGYDKYSEYIPTTIKLTDFELPADEKSPRQLVEAFFKTNSNYLLGKPMRVEYDPMNFEVDAYHGMLHHHGVSTFDGRHQSVELHFKKDFLIKKGNILAVIVPESLLGEWLARETAELDVPYFTYQVDFGRPNDYIPKISERAMVFFKDML